MAIKITRISILHVEDEPGFRDLVSEYLEREDPRFEIDCVGSAHDALDAIESNQYDCIVSDYDMPGMDGVDLLESVRETHSNLPFILFTGKGSEEIASEAISKGVTDYLQKGGPETFELLDNRIGNVVEKRRANQHAERVENRYQKLVEEANDAIIVVNDDGTFEYISSASKSVLGHDDDELLANNGFEYIHPDDVDNVLELFDEMVKNPEFRPRTEFRFEQPDGSWTWIEVEGRNLRDNPTIGGHVVYARDISDRKKREKNLRTAKLQIKTANKAGRVGTWQWRVQDDEIVADAEFSHLFDVDPDAAAQGVSIDKFIDAIHPDDRDKVLDAIDESLESGDEFEIEYRVTNKDDEVRWVLARGLVEYDDDGEPVSFPGAVMDVTRFHAQQKQLLQFESFIEHSPDLFVLMNEFGEIKYVSQTETSFSGFNAPDITGEFFLERVHPDDHGEARELYENTVNNPGEQQQGTLRLQDEDDNSYWVHIRALNRLDHPDINGIIVVIRDVTEHIERQLDVKQEHDRLNAVFSATPEPLILVDFHDGKPVIQRANNAFIDTFSDDKESVIGKPVDDLIVPERFTDESDSLNEQSKHGEPFEKEVVRTTVDGEKTFKVTVAPVGEFSDEGTTEWVAAYVDMSIIRERERELEQSFGRLEYVLNSTSTIMWEYDFGMNDVEFFGPVNSIIGMDQSRVAEPADLLDKTTHPDDVNSVRDEFEDLISGEQESFFTEFRTHPDNGHVRIIRTKAALKTSDNGEPWKILGMSTDVSRQHEQEQQLEEFANVVSHDLRNPLSVALGHVDLLQKDINHDSVTSIDEALHRMNELIDDVLALAKEGKDAEKTDIVDLQELVKGCWELVDTADATVAVNTTRNIQCDKQRLKQLFENLFRNAIEHGGPDVTIEVGDLNDGFFIEDNGPGIPQDERKAVFDAGETTDDSGTGLGLAIVKRIVDAHGWTIRANEGDEGGARFEITNVSDIVSNPSSSSSIKTD